jgi:hypothetical protein
MNEAYKPRLDQFKEAPMEPIEEEATYQVAFELGTEVYALPFEASALDAVIIEHTERGEPQLAVPGGTNVWTIEGYEPGLLGPFLCIAETGAVVLSPYSFDVEEELTDEGYVHTLTAEWPEYQVPDPENPEATEDQLPEEGLEVYSVYGVKKKLLAEEAVLTDDNLSVDIQAFFQPDILGSQLTIMYRKKIRGAFERPED